MATEAREQAEAGRHYPLADEEIELELPFSADDDLPRPHDLPQALRADISSLQKLAHAEVNKDQFPEAMTGEHLRLAIRVVADREKRGHSLRKLRFIFMIVGSLAALAGAVLGVLGLCWLFLAYNKPEFIGYTLGLIFAFLGGFAAGFGARTALHFEKNSSQ